VSSIENYRPITLSSVISKLFESVVLDKFQAFMKTDDLQFGFKKGLSCSHAIYALRQGVEYFSNRGSNTYIASLDASKAFDLVNHLKLFSTLIKRGLPTFLIDTIINWYQKLSVVVRWNGCLSCELRVFSGVRQGGILSPFLFNIYVDYILSKIRMSDLGCHICNMYIGCIMYADDLLLISSSIIDLQKMLEICDGMGANLGIKFNALKSKCISIGPDRSIKLASMTISNAKIDWVEKIKYLGITILAGATFRVGLSEARRKFFISANSIINKCQHASDMTKLSLVEFH